MKSTSFATQGALCTSSWSQSLSVSRGRRSRSPSLLASQACVLELAVRRHLDDREHKHHFLSLHGGIKAKAGSISSITYASSSRLPYFMVVSLRGWVFSHYPLCTKAFE